MKASAAMMLGQVMSAVLDGQYSRKAYRHRPVRTQSADDKTFHIDRAAVKRVRKSAKLARDAARQRAGYYFVQQF